MTEYEQFLENKKHSIGNDGINPITSLPQMFDFQEYVANYSIKKGRCADFLDTGLGKTIIELVISKNFIQSTNKPVLIITPLAVAFQFLTEAEKFGIDDIEYSKLGKFTKKIVVCNYERLHFFNPNDFNCVICDESSLLKNSDGATRNFVTAFLRKVKYRFLFTATPSPNDFIELGTSSEALGYLGNQDMLSKFFSNNEDTISPQKIGCEWVLKPHATETFFKWVSGWSISARKPSDLGFSDEKHILPELITNDHSIRNENNMVVKGQILMFNQVAKTNEEILVERKQTIGKRCEKAVELSSPHERSVYWCNLNTESELIKQLDKNAYEIKGTMDIDEKEEMLLGFFSGDIKKLITKPKITCFGLNWQHCSHTVYFPTFSYEQYYQAIRRFWRFGQKNKVIVDRVYSDGQKRVLDSIVAKAEKANQLFDKLNINLNTSFEVQKKEFNKQIIKPSFL